MATRVPGDVRKHLQDLFHAGAVGGMTDGQLLERFAQGEAAAEIAFSSLVARHGPMVMRVCRALLGDTHEAEDAFQATFYTSLLPYIEQATVSPGDPRPIATFLCPSRRGPNCGPRADYAAGRHPDDFFRDGSLSVLGGPFVLHTGQVVLRGGVGLNMVGGGDGSSNTLLLSHKAMSPSDYYRPGAPPGDGGWVGGPGAGQFDHKRDPRSIVRDMNSPEMWKYIGSAHPGGIPSLFADGSVRTLSYSTSQEVIPKLWSWNDGSILPSDGP